jgi:Tol biopolymer transport system component
MFVHDGRLVGRPFDDRWPRITGAEFSIAESNTRVLMEPLRGDFSASETGVLAYGPTRAADQLTWYDRNGVRLETFAEPGIHLAVTLSPNEQEVAFSQLEPYTGKYDIWRVNRASGVASRVTYGSKDQFDPVWLPDGTRIVYGCMHLVFSSKNLDTSGEIYETPSGGGDHKLLLKSDNLKLPWSTNGRFLLYHEMHSGKKIDTWALPIEDRGKAVPLLQGQSNQLFAVFSPDGKWVAYASDESGKQEVYVTPFAPGTASTTSGSFPTAGALSRNGRVMAGSSIIWLRTNESWQSPFRRRRAAFSPALPTRCSSPISLMTSELALR